MAREPEQGENLEEGALSRWTFLTNHAHVLILLAQQPGIVMREVAARVGVTERAVQRIVGQLVEDGYLQREKVGRQYTYHLELDRPLRHPIEGHCRVRDIVQVILAAEG